MVVACRSLDRVGLRMWRCSLKGMDLRRCSKYISNLVVEEW